MFSRCFGDSEIVERGKKIKDNIYPFVTYIILFVASAYSTAYKYRTKYVVLSGKMKNRYLSVTKWKRDAVVFGFWFGCSRPRPVT